MALRKPIVPQGRGGVLQQPKEEWASQFPTVWEFISLTVWEDGTPRTPGSVTLFAEDASWKACVNDKGMGLVAFTTAGSVEGLLEALEHGLSTGLMDWRKSRPAAARQKAK